MKTETDISPGLLIRTLSDKEILMKTVLLNVNPHEIRMAVMEEGRLTDFETERPGQDGLMNRIYKGVVKNIVPQIQGIFVDIGIGQNAFLRMSDLPRGRKEPLSEGVSLLVQVIREGTATKGPCVTGAVSFPGRYAVVLTDTDYIGISKQIRAEEKRRSLREMGRRLCPPGTGLILRTAAGDAGQTELEQELRKLTALRETVLRRARLARAPSLLYREGDLIVRTLRDYISGEEDRIIVDEREAWQRLREIASGDTAGQAPDILLYEEEEPLLEKWNAEEQVRNLFDRQVSLPSGGTVVFDHTEALTAVDVNSGSFHKKGIDQADMAFLTNREAAGEIARQIRMRGIGGMILIDFIDMESTARKKQIVDILKKETARDRVKTVVCGMTSLGLVEMTRKRTAHQLWYNQYDMCPFCGGRGRALSPYSVQLSIERKLRDMKRRRGGTGPLLIQCHPDVRALLEEPGEHRLLETLCGRSIRTEDGTGRDRTVYTFLMDTAQN